MKTMILVWGSAERGKSQSIKRLAMSLPFSSIIRPWNADDYDSYVIGTIKDNDGNERIVGLESQGDPYSNQKEWIEACVSANCEVIVAASRSYGQTVRNARDAARDNGYEIIKVTTLFHDGGPMLDNGTDLRDVFAENMQHLIMKCLE
jgi:hypothetical protein